MTNDILPRIRLCKYNAGATTHRKNNADGGFNVKNISILAAALLLVMATAAYAAEHNHGHADIPADPHAHAHGETPETEHADLNLMQVMHDLGSNLNRIQWGIMTNNRYMVEQGAAGIASHPMPKGGLKPYIKKNADMIKDAVPVYDEQVHKTAVQMKEQSTTATMLELQKMAATMGEGCVNCHDVFRNP